VRERAVGPRGIPPDLMARRVARLLGHGEYVNLGTGLPTLVSDHLEAAQAITLHSENGMLGFGPLAGATATDIHRYNASGQLVSGLPGESFTDSADAFAMARSGRVTTIVLGGFRSRRAATSRTGASRRRRGRIGGAMDLAVGAGRIVVLVIHLTRDGRPKLVPACALSAHRRTVRHDGRRTSAWWTSTPRASAARGRAGRRRRGRARGHRRTAACRRAYAMDL
jgi:3-oxoacid CoA-transferase B subunit